jgi:hypothetical protein
MRKLIVAAVLLQLTLSGCAYSSANLMRAKGDDIMVFGAWGYVKCKNSSITLYRSTDAISYLKDKDAKYPKIPPRPTISEEGTDIVIGKTAKPADATPEETPTK